MPVRKTGNFDLQSIIVKREKERLASMLTPEEFSQIGVSIEGSRISIAGPQEIMDKIKALKFVPEQSS